MVDKIDDLPVMVYDWKDERIRQIAENIWHAQMAGWPAILTYVWRPRKYRIRGKSLRGIPNIESRDEYPFASTLENEGSVWVGHAPAEKQNKQGTLISAFYARHGAYKKGTTFKFRVSVINFPTKA
jgi:hypothetical protein